MPSTSPIAYAVDSGTANAPMIEASSSAIANSTPASLPALASRPCAIPAVSGTWPKPCVPENAAAVSPSSRQRR